MTGQLDLGHGIDALGGEGQNPSIRTLPDVSAHSPDAYRIQEGSEPLPAFGRYGGGEALCVAQPEAAAITSAYKQFSIGAMVKGTLDYRSSAGRIRANPGTLLFGNLGEEFSYRFDGHGLVKRAVLALDENLVEEASSAIGVSPTFGEPGLPRSRNLAKHYGWVRRLALGQPVHEDILLEIVLLALGADHALSSYQMSERDRRSALEIAARLNETYFESWDLDRMSNEAGMSRFQFIRVFKQALGENPRQHLIAARLRAAADRLLETRDPITTIALGVGFNDISHFNLTFKAAFGKAPRAWRDAA